MTKKKRRRRVSVTQPCIEFLEINYKSYTHMVTRSIVIPSIQFFLGEGYRSFSSP